MSCDVGCRCGSDLALLWLWCRVAVAALIRLLAWELPHAAGAALKRPKKEKKKTKKKQRLTVLFTVVTQMPRTVPGTYTVDTQKYSRENEVNRKNC